MLPVRYIERSLLPLAPHLREIVLELRNLVAEVCPDATETVHRYWIAYHHKEQGGPVSAGICQIIFMPAYVQLAFVHGVFLPDPHGLLVADDKRKYKRYVPVADYEQAPWEALRELIAASASLDPRSLSASRENPTGKTG